MSIETAAPFPVTREEYGVCEYRRKIEPEPEFDGDLWIWKGEAWNWEDLEYELLSAPLFTPGQVLAVQEEWATREAWDHLDDDKVPEGYCVYYRSERCEIDDDWFKWRSASTLPLWAVRKWERVTEVSVDGDSWVVRTEEVER